jgi:hypothetical protein
LFESVESLRRCDNPPSTWNDQRDCRSGNAVDLPVSADNRSSLASQTVTVNLRLQRSDNPEH